ncbi:unnamed protein product [Lactuca virosa]|uniref:Replication factor A C-terminal domain-containing protein n=1 Tax=Lactuca virosa TaxID=75947 RepID=A0AAU9M0R3_9ASTR|nr:unnamed protein product [Lactuca virosa]
MTINKSQGQSLRKIGIYLSQPVFAHGQLYVALSRATSPDSIKILINSSDTTKNNETKNVVFKDLLHKVTSTENFIFSSKYPAYLYTFLYIREHKQPMTSISEQKAEGIGGPLHVRILRKWKHDVRQYETWYLTVDRFADAIQILGQRTNQSYIEYVSNVSECYIISDYSCPQLDKYQKVLENDFYIDVGLKSIIQRIPDTITVPKTWFHFVSKSHLIELGEAPPYYPGALRHGSSHATHIYVNPNIPETTSLINLFTGPSRPIPALSGTPSTLYDMKLKNRSDLLDKTFIVQASIKEFHFQNTWYQTTCLICKDPIFRRGDQWYCSAHGLIEKPTYTYKLTVTITDTTDTIPAIVSETSCQKLLKSSLEKFISNNPLTNRNNLPSIITDQKEQTKTMSIQMLRASTPDNIRFIIIDIQQSTTPPESPVPTTPGQTRMPRMRSDDGTPQASEPPRPVARTLTFTPPGPPPTKIQKRTSK